MDKHRKNGMKFEVHVTGKQAHAPHYAVQIAYEERRTWDEALRLARKFARSVNSMLEKPLADHHKLDRVYIDFPNKDRAIALGVPARRIQPLGNGMHRICIHDFN